MRDIGKNIRYYREKMGYSQEQLAQLLFVTRQTVSNYETGRSRPDVETLVKLAGLLNIEVTDLIYGPRQISVSRRSCPIGKEESEEASAEKPASLPPETGENEIFP